MKTINYYIFERSSKKVINEKLKLNNQSKLDKGYHYHPKEYSELLSLLNKLIKERGEDANLNDIDVSKITDMGGLFKNIDARPHNINISKWDVRNVTNMYGMFERCYYFNCDLTDWNVKEVRNMSNMFRDCEQFKGKGLEKWNVINVKHMKHMFDNCTSLKNRPSWYK